MKTKLLKIPAFGQSMHPFFQSGDMLFIQSISIKKLQVNDFITFPKRNIFITHRVIYIPTKRNYVITKGDTNFKHDGKIKPERIIGKVIKVKRNGKMYTPDTIYQLQSFFYTKEINRINKTLHKKAIDFVFLKGLPLHLYYEKTIPKRIYADCDILIDKKNENACVAMFEQLGYVKQNIPSTVPHAFRPEASQFNMTKIIHNIPISFDIHTHVCFLIKQFGDMSPLYSQKLLDQLSKEFLEKKRFISIANNSFPILQKENLILYLSMHLFSHNLKGYNRYEALKNILQNQKTDFTSLATSILTYDLKNFVYPIFLFLQKYYPVDLPQSFLTEIKPSPKTITYINTHLLTTDIFSDERKVHRGKGKFRHLFFLSPYTIFRKITIFFSFPVLFSIIWVSTKKLQEYQIYMKSHYKRLFSTI